MRDVTTVTAEDVRITARDPVRDAGQRVLGRLWIDKVPVRLASDDPTLWGLPAGAVRSWPAAPGATRALLPRIREAAGRAGAAGLADVVLVGRGAPAAAARVVARYAKAPLTVLDGLDPAPTLRLAVDPDRLRRTVVVVTGDDPAAAAHTAILRRLFRDLGLDHEGLAERFLDVPAGEPGGAGGRVFGALSPDALFPAALAGADVPQILDQATAVLPSLTRPENNPGLVLGAILAGCARSGRDKVVIADIGSPFGGMGEWAGRLLADATGTPRAGARYAGGLVPIVQGGGLPLSPGDDLFLVALDGRPHQDDATLSGSLGAQLVVWEYAAAVAAYVLGADPFAGMTGGAETEPDTEGDAEPSIESAGQPQFRDRDIDGYTGELDDSLGAGNVTAVLDLLLGAIPRDGHLAILAYLDPDPFLGQGRGVRRVAAALAARGGRPVTVCWDPVASPTGTVEEKGVYLVLTGNVMDDKPVLDEGDRLSRLQLAQALQTTETLRERGRPVARLHLHHRWTGIAQLLDAAHQGGRA
jgi:glucose-6-phosphate isomerase